MKFGMFYVGEFLHVFTIGALIATFFLGGWRGPGAETYPVLGFVYFYAKAFLGYFIITWVRLSLPRIRIDHMLDLNWKFLTPLALVLLMVTAVMDKFLVNTLGFESLSSGYSIGMFIANIVVGWITLVVVRKYARDARVRVADPQPVASPDASAPPVADSSSAISSST